MGKIGKTGKPAEGSFGLGGFLGGLSALIEKVGELAEKGQDLQKSGEFHDAQGKVRGVYGFNIKVGGLGQEGVQVEPFGNLRKDEHTGKATVQEVREPMVDVFEEDGYVQVVAEMPGVAEKDVQLDLKDDILTIAASRGATKYRKELLLPRSFSEARMTHTCRNGVLEVKLANGRGKRNDE